MSRKLVFISTIIALATSFGSDDIQAQDISKNEQSRYQSTGIMAGAAIGAAIAGPPGAVITAAAGGWLSEQVLAAKSNKLLKAELTSTIAKLQSLQDQHSNLQVQYQSLAQLQEQHQQVASLSLQQNAIECCLDSALTLHFRTNSAQVEAHYQTELKHFVNTALAMPDAVVEISGHADRRGASAENLALSQRRVQSVEATLRELGLRKVKTNTRATGEEQLLSSEDNFEQNFFDRRVTIRLLPDAHSLLTNNQQ